MALGKAGQAAAAAIIATLLAALTSCTSANTSRPAGHKVAAVASSPSAAGAPSKGIPGNDPSIQHWFLKVGNAKVAFDNALFQAEQGIAKHVASMCKPLDQKIHPILSALPGLRNIPSRAGSEIADALEPAMRTFSKMGGRCAAGDFAGARALMPTGVRQQAAGQTKIDEILDGDANLGGSQ